MGTVGRFIREQIEATGKQQKVIAAEIAEAVIKDGGKKVEPSTVETKLSKLLGEESWREGHRFFLEDPTRRKALATVLEAAPEEMDERIAAARGEIVLLLDPNLPPEAKAYLGDAESRAPGKFRLKAVEGGSAGATDDPRALRDAAASCDSPWLVLSAATAGKHALFFEGADLQFVGVEKVKRGWVLSGPLRELVPLPPPPPPRLQDNDGHPMVEDEELIGLLLKNPYAFNPEEWTDITRRHYSYKDEYDRHRPDWVVKALAAIQQAKAEERRPTIRLEYVVDYRLRKAVDSGRAEYVAAWGNKENLPPSLRTYWNEQPRGLFEQEALEEYSNRREASQHPGPKTSAREGLPHAATLLTRIDDPALALYWRHEGTLYRLGKASSPLGLPEAVAPKPADAGVALLAELAAHNFDHQDEPGFIRFREEAAKAAAPYGISLEPLFDCWSNSQIAVAEPPYRLNQSKQIELVREARQELREFCLRDAVLDDSGLDLLDILTRAARAPLRVLEAAKGCRLVRAELGGGRIAHLRYRRFAKTPKRHLVQLEGGRRGTGILDGGDLQILLDWHEVQALEGPHLAASSARKRAVERAHLEDQMQQDWDDYYQLMMDD